MKTLLLTLIVTLITSPSFAHVALVTSNPADGVSLDTSPKMVMLTLSEPAMITGFELVKEGGETIKTGDTPKEMTNMVHVSLPTLTSGKYTLTWRAASKDMHAMSNTITFTVK